MEQGKEKLQAILRSHTPPSSLLPVRCFVCYSHYCCFCVGTWWAAYPFYLFSINLVPILSIRYPSTSSLSTRKSTSFLSSGHVDASPKTTYYDLCDEIGYAGSYSSCSNLAHIAPHRYFKHDGETRDHREARWTGCDGKESPAIPYLICQSESSGFGGR